MTFYKSRSQRKERNKTVRKGDKEDGRGLRGRSEEEKNEFCPKVVALR
jgi:hypothetical protein